MLKILLMQPPFAGESIISLEKYEPTGLIALAAYVRDKHNNIEFKIYDSSVEQEYSIQSAIDFVLECNPHILGLSSMTTNFEAALQIAQAVKKAKPQITIIMGGVHSTIAPQDVLLNPAIDFLVIGEGEVIFNEWLENVNNLSNYKNIKGLGYKENGQVKINPRRELIKDLDELPLPAYDLLKIEKYHSPYATRSPFVSMIRSRGCPFRCIFCGVQNMFARTYRVQTPERTIKEIDYLVDKFKIKEIGFKDSEFTINVANVKKLCDLMIQRKYDLIWSCNARVNCNDLKLYKKMYQAGCRTVAFGTESGDQNTLNILKKDVTLAQSKQAVAAAQQAGIRVSANFMIGNPGETKQAIKNTIQFAKQINPDYTSFVFTTPFPGTELYEMAVKNNWLLNPNLKNTDYNITYLTMNATQLSNEELGRCISRAYREFYLRPAYVFKKLKTLRKNEIMTNLKGLKALLKNYFLKNTK